MIELNHVGTVARKMSCLRRSLYGLDGGVGTRSRFAEAYQNNNL